MTLVPAGNRHDPSPLGCRLHDWTLASREGVPDRRRRDVRGIILDLDDTLYRHEDFVRSGFMAVATQLERAHGVTAHDAFDFLLASRRSDARGAEFQALCARHQLRGELVAWMLDVFRTHRPSVTLPRASVSALTTLRLDGWRLVVLTNGIPAVQRAKVRALGVASLVDSVVYAEEHAPGGKPAVTVFVEALRRIGAPAGRAICVGDDPVRDIAGARQLGIRTVHLRTTTMMPDPQADAILSSLDTLPAVARELLEGAESDAA